MTQDVLPLLPRLPPMSVMPAEPRRMGAGYHHSLQLSLRPTLTLTCHLERGLLTQLPSGVTQALLVTRPQNSSMRHSGLAGAWVLPPRKPLRQARLCESSTPDWSTCSRNAKSISFSALWSSVQYEFLCKNISLA